MADIENILKHQKKDLLEINKLLLILIDNIDNTNHEKKPKGAKNAYIYFCMENRQNVKNSNPKLDNKNITKLLSNMWKNLTSHERVSYQAKADQDKIRFNNEMQSFGKT